jgi:hypothetical protein
MLLLPLVLALLFGTRAQHQQAGSKTCRCHQHQHQQQQEQQGRQGTTVRSSLQQPALSKSQRILPLSFAGLLRLWSGRCLRKQQQQKQ